MPPSRSLLWRVLPWLFPLGLVVVGLLFVTASLTGTDQPKDIAAPPNVRDVTNLNAKQWAARQVTTGTTSQVTGVVMVSSTASSSSVYAVRAVIGRIDTPSATPASGVVRTVVTCVSWDVDVRTGTIAEHGADQLSNTVGSHPLGDTGALRSACAKLTFTG